MVEVHKYLVNGDRYTGSWGGSSVLFAYSFLLLFGRIDKIYKGEQDSLYIFSWRGIQGHLFNRKKFYLFVCGFRDMFFEGSAPTFHGGSPRNSLQSDMFLWEALEIPYNQTCFCSGLEYLFIR